MRGSGTALAIALTLVVVACDSTTTPSGSPGASAPAPTSGTRSSQPPKTPAPTAATILAVDPGRRPAGPWAVTFQVIGSPAVREVYVLSPACAEPTCDLNATVQTYDGIAIGTAVFHHADGRYRYEATSRDSVDCEDGFGTVADGATQVSHTTLVIAGYRAVGSAVVNIDIRGTRSVTIEPVAGGTCEPSSMQYVANGEATRFAAAPAASPKPPTISGSLDIKTSYFGAGAKVVTYAVSGGSIVQIISSIRANGPWSEWAQARAEAVTRATPRYRFSLEGTGGACRIRIASRQAILFSYTITLPSWTRSTGVDPATVRWWTTEIQRVAAHEKHHVDLFRTGATRLSDAVDRGTCANVSSRLATIAKDIATQQCAFDIREYGTALGLSLASCVNQ